VAARRERRWRAAAAAIEADVRTHGFDPGRNTYVGKYGRPELDAALLLLPASGFEPAGSDRAWGTVEAVRRELSAGGPLLYRTPPAPGEEAREGAFVACSFWMVRALLSVDRSDDAGALMEETCRLANEVGLFAEEIDPTTREHLGNFPQALSHSALVQAAQAMERAEEASAAGGSRRGSRRTPRGR
jgi:GH15 family glucan-1,4-alpha-glucosidase